MCDIPAKKLKAARLSAGYAEAREAFDAHQHKWPFKYPTYVSYENGHRPITADAARVLAATFKRVGLKFSDLYPIDEDIPTAPDIPVVGVVQMGVWRDVRLEEERENAPRLRGLPRTGIEARRALHVLDESVNKYIGPGEYAIYTPLYGDLGPLDQYDGELVFVELVVNNLAERSIRLATLQKNGVLKLTGHSDMAKYAASPYFYPCTEGRVQLLGVIIGRYAERRSKFSTD